MKELLDDNKLKQMPFEVDENYFSSLEERLRERVGLQEPQEKRSIFFKVVRASWGIAAAFLLVAGFGYGAKVLTDRYLNRQAMAEQTQELHNPQDFSRMLDSLEYYYAYNLEGDLEGEAIEEPSEEDDIEAVTEYITLAPPSYEGLIAEEIGGIREY